MWKGFDRKPMAYIDHFPREKDFIRKVRAYCAFRDVVNYVHGFHILAMIRFDYIQ